MEKWLKPGETIEDLGLRGLRIIQKETGFRFGIDAVLLAWFAAEGIKAKSRVADVGTGTAILPLLVYGRTGVSHIDALEIQPSMAEMAARSVALNGLEKVITVHQGDVKAPPEVFASSAYDVVISNPPYMKTGGGKQNASPEVALARHEVAMKIDDLATFAKRTLKDKGKLYLVHRADRLGEVMAALQACKIEPKILTTVHPYGDKPANLILLAGVKKGRPGMRVTAPLIVYEQDGSYTQAINDIYGTAGPTPRDGQ